MFTMFLDIVLEHSTSSLVDTKRKWNMFLFWNYLNEAGKKTDLGDETGLKLEIK